jgi:hypothetical protein
MSEVGKPYESLLDSIKPDAEAEEPSAPLWHYTDAAGLHGILTSRCIRATHVAHLNDPTEVVHGEMLAKALVNVFAWPTAHVPRHRSPDAISR